MKPERLKVRVSTESNLQIRTKLASYSFGVQKKSLLFTTPRTPPLHNLVCTHPPLILTVSHNPWTSTLVRTKRCRVDKSLLLPTHHAGRDNLRARGRQLLARQSKHPSFIILILARTALDGGGQ
ncbi:uncharacterized protein LOC119767484 isoform X1 [Culex quinquefasciatus]|uniref:uncharacterized protein LOC119767484 isoform X1 n=1 Tax=Culex quinquefasciatus TaxID=7176 RepID=UPI0018E39070|nr:uncharacterized protein LOC119767484 isoform X1 [Culex quinquefasciatus]